jgi:DNA-binding SARP family transcriptional activator
MSNIAGNIQGQIAGKIQVKLFGATTVVTAEGTVLSDLGGIKPRQVLEILALAVGTPVSKDRLVELLWGDNPPRTYTGTLESYISLLRRKMGIARGRGSALATTSNGYLLDATQVSVDLDQFRRLTQPAPGTSPEQALAATGQALDLITGELLTSEPYAEWAGDERAGFGAEYLAACNRAAEHALTVGDPHTAITLARRGIETDSISETAWQLLIRGLSATGARSEALRAYLDLRATLIDALGTEPSPTSRALYLDLLAEDRTTTTPTTSINEVKTLLALLRDALDGMPHIDLSINDRKLTARAERLVAAA